METDERHVVQIDLGANGRLTLTYDIANKVPKTTPTSIKMMRHDRRKLGNIRL